MESDAVLVISAVILSYAFLYTRLFYSPSEHTYNPFLAITIFRIPSFFLKEIATTLNISNLFLLLVYLRKLDLSLKRL